MTTPPAPLRVLLLGATGTIGRATAGALLRRGYRVLAPVRARPGETLTAARTRCPWLAGAEVRLADVTDPGSLRRDAIGEDRLDAVLSCLASRTGVPRDAWAIDHAAHLDALAAGRDAGARHFVLLSAICVQKPRLAFQRAKLAFEQALATSGLRYSIVRPTAFFKSLSGQLGRLRAGKPFLVFGDGRLTACKPIADDDLGEYLAGCLDDPARWDRILPIGGPGPALTPVEQGALLFAALGQPPRYARVPVALLDGIIGVLRVLGTVAPPLRDKAELARIGRYYATESMLVWDEGAGRYDADATPETGRETLGAYYGRLVRGELDDERGAHAVF